ncbi:MAG: response regulator transcription factor [Anaerolineales bacterium]|nr:response regulator transcription factor [Anaerolineales bacterium]
METIRVVLAEDHTIVRQGLRSILEQQPGIEVIAEAENGREAVQIAEQLKPDLVLMDFSMPELNGLEATRQIKQRVPEVKVLILTRHANQEYVKSILGAGASGYLIKKSAADELVLAIQSVYKGNSFLDPSISKMVIEGYLHQAEGETQDQGLKITPRQREVLQLIAEGHPNREIASILHISVKTVDNHRANLMGKLGLSSTADLIQYAIRQGIISLDD